MFERMKRYLDRSSDKWRVEIIRRDTPNHANWVTRHVNDWTFVGEAFNGHQSEDAVGHWNQFQGTLDNCIFWLTKRMHASWSMYGQFRIRNTVTKEIIPAELFL